MNFYLTISPQKYSIPTSLKAAKLTCRAVTTETEVDLKHSTNIFIYKSTCRNISVVHWITILNRTIKESNLTATTVVYNFKFCGNPAVYSCHIKAVGAF